MQLLELCRNLNQEQRTIILAEHDRDYFLAKALRIKTGRGIEPFTPFPYQSEFLKLLEDHRKLVVLKARQVGFTWLMAAYALKHCLFQSNREALFISINDERSKEIIERADFLYREMSPTIKNYVKLVKSNMSEMLFSNGSKLQSVPTTKEAGRSKSLTLLIIDEAAHVEWADDIWTAAAPSVTATDGQVIILSTANGVGNFFHKLWNAAIKHENDFYPYFVSWSGVPSRTEQWMAEQIKNATDKDVIPQEYPNTAEEAFLVSGRPVFDQKKLMAMLKKIVAPQTGDIVEVHGENGVQYRFDPDPKGWLQMWAKPLPELEYRVGADVAEGLIKDSSKTGDWSVAIVKEAASWEQVAMVRGHPDPDKFAEQLNLLGRFYNNALMAVERNNHGQVCLNILEKYDNYPNLYFEEITDQRTDLTTKRMGWVTSRKSKDDLIDCQKVALRDDLTRIVSDIVIQEHLSFMKDEDGRCAGALGCNDDCVMADSISTKMCEKNPPVRRREMRKPQVTRNSTGY